MSTKNNTTSNYNSTNNTSTTSTTSTNNNSNNNNNSNVHRLLQWNILSDGLSMDGFLSTEFQPIHDKNKKAYPPREFLQLIRDAKTVEQREKLQQQFQGSPELERVQKEILPWSKRCPKLISLIERLDADILTFQELDHMQQFMQLLGNNNSNNNNNNNNNNKSNNYACTLDDASAQNYKPAKYESIKDKSSKDDLSYDNYMPHVLKAKTSFAPKSYSHSRNFKLKLDGAKEETDGEDDGPAIFWKKDRYTPLELGFLQSPMDKKGKTEAVVAVVLQDKSSRERINVITTHLPSGDDSAKELERLASLKDPSKSWKAQRLVLTLDATKTKTHNNKKKEWKQDDYAGTKFDGVLSFVQYYSQNKNDTSSSTSTTIFALDANSRPTFPTKDIPTKTNTWEQIKQHTGLTSVWTQLGFLNDKGESTDPKHPFCVSVNKMRGPASNQPKKIGQHQVELIDHVFVSTKQNVKALHPNKQDLVANTKSNTKTTDGTTTTTTKKDLASFVGEISPLLYTDKETAELELMPNSKIPSDHLPIVVDIQIGNDNGNGNGDINTNTNNNSNEEERPSLFRKVSSRILKMVGVGK